jgi:ubiquinone/menaquinone biosynthesis C-methylase UbiE
MTLEHVLFACPVCHNVLGGLECSACGQSYDMVNGVRSFISRRQYSSDEAFSDAQRIIEFWGKGWEKRFAEPDHAFLFSSSEEELRAWAKSDIDWQKENDSLLANDFALDESIEGKTVLNIGTGAGTEALLISLSGANCIAMDVTSQAAKAAELLMQKTGGRGVGIQADARFIPLESSSVDIVSSSGVLHHSPDVARSVSEIHRVLKPGGTAFIMLYATWSIMFLQMRLMLSMGERAWETEGRKNPCTTTYTAAECKSLFSQFDQVAVRKTGASLRQIKVIGRLLPTIFDRALDPYLGPRFNIVASKQ